MASEFRIKPLSEGIGLGTLRAPAAKRIEQSPLDMSPRQQMGYDVYQQQSVGTALKKAPRTRAFVWMTRALVGWGLDLVMAVVTITLCSVFGLMAWRMGMGASDATNPLSAVALIAKTLTQYGRGAIPVAVLGGWALYWFLMKVTVGSTAGSNIRHPK